jgi:putative hydrolase
MHPLRLDEDWHVHSTFSDGTDTLAANLAAAAERGLTRLGCVDHVRRDSTHVAAFVQAMRALRDTTPITVTAGVEAKILDAAGTLDLPPELGDVDFVYVADHQFPDEAGPVSPHAIRDAIGTGRLTPVEVVEELVNATIAAMVRYAPLHRLVLTHPFSILPKLSLTESTVADEAIARLLATAHLTETAIEVSERWRCPSERVVTMAAARHVRLVASTDSHRAADVGRYAYVARIAANLGATHRFAA